MAHLRTYPGWFGVFTREEAEGAFPNGTRVVKTAGEPSDTHPKGATGTVLGSILHPEHGFGSGYFVEWDDHPRCAVLVVAWKVEALPTIRTWPTFGPGAPRAEHLAMCKRRALEYVDLGQLDQAAASMVSDLSKHPETCPPVRVGDTRYIQAVEAIMRKDAPALRRWIEEFS